MYLSLLSERRMPTAVLHHQSLILLIFWFSSNLSVNDQLQSSKPLPCRQKIVDFFIFFQSVSKYLGFYWQILVRWKKQQSLLTNEAFYALWNMLLLTKWTSFGKIRKQHRKCWRSKSGSRSGQQSVWSRRFRKKGVLVRKNWKRNGVWEVKPSSE